MNKTSAIFKILFIYFILIYLWVLFADNLIYGFIKNKELLSIIQLYKDWLFIIITLIILFFLMKFTTLRPERKSCELNKIFNSLVSPIIIINEEGKVLLINKTFEKITGYKYEEIDTIDKWTKNAYRERAQENKNRIMSLFSLENLADNGDYTIYTKDNKQIIWQFNKAPYTIIDNKRTIIATALDITELKEKEKMMMQKSKMAAMGEILENIAHQWRQPLSTIATASTAVKLQKDFGNLTNEKLIESMDLINNSAQHLSKTIDDFRGFFKPDQKKEYFKINHTFEKIMLILGNKFKKEEIEFIKDIEEFQILNYNNALIQVFMNIFNNSKDAFDENKIEEKLIFIEAYNDEYNLVIQIKDTAGGIPSKVINKVFEPYFTTKHQSHGTGIGLYMCEEIITKHMQGKIKVENKRFIYNNKSYTGAMFTITLPHTI